MKKILLLNLMIFTFFLSYSQENTPEIKFIKEIIDYGEIKKGSDGIRIFNFINTGKSPLKINKVYSSCGCTIPKKPQEVILPGKEGEIQVKYDTNRIGPIRKTITVNSNASKSPIVILEIKGSVKEN
tara:strand:+ start:1204 stop:1584 length:381 start_codon:yes stop_codon:yes gene_type:complete